MSTYKEIRGLKVRDYTTNPDNPIEGQLWYNTTDNVAKYQIPNVLSAWRSGNNMNTARSIPGGIGIQTAALALAGYISDNTAIVEQYDGTSWTEVNDLNTATRGLGTSGTNIGCTCFFGNTPGSSTSNKNEEWNGSSWTETTDGNTGRRYFGGVGTSAEAALAFAGEAPTTAEIGLTESWNGTSWTEVNDLNTARGRLGSGGIETSALAFGGDTPGTPSGVTNTESWNGSSWTEVKI